MFQELANLYEWLLQQSSLGTNRPGLTVDVCFVFQYMLKRIHCFSLQCLSGQACREFNKAMSCSSMFMVTILCARSSVQGASRQRSALMGSAPLTSSCACSRTTTSMCCVTCRCAVLRVAPCWLDKAVLRGLSSRPTSCISYGAATSL